MWHLTLLSRLPLAVLYRLADFLCFILYFVVRYRRTVVQRNLQAAFPYKSPSALRAITKQVYQNIAEIIVEVIKIPRMGAADFHTRVDTRAVLAQLTPYFQAGQPVLALAAHQCNWEWLLQASGEFSTRVAGLYRPLHNKKYDDYLLKMRSATGVQMIVARRAMLALRRPKPAHALVLAVADQGPAEVERKVWVPCLNQDTAFSIGVEVLAKRLGYPVFFVGVKRLRRGYYQTYLQLLAEPPYEGASNQYDIMQAYAKAVEQQVLDAPGNWLWTNRRWKHQRPREPEIKADA